MDGWVKLHRRILKNELVRDHTSLLIFIWLLLKVDKTTGKKSVARFWASEELGLKSNTFYKALKRLEKKWQMVTLSSNNRYTEVQIVNWLKYQQTKSASNSAGNNKVTTGSQQGNTLQEVKNKEVKKREGTHTALEWLLNIPVEDMDGLRKETSATENDVRSKGEDLYNYCQSKGRTYKDYRALLRNSVKRDYPPKKDLFENYKLLKKA